MEHSQVFYIPKVPAAWQSKFFYSTIYNMVDLLMIILSAACFWVIKALIGWCANLTQNN